MAAFLPFIAPSSTPISLSRLRLSFSFKPKRVSSASTPKAKTIPATDLVIDFGKHKGKMLGTLPSNYLRWVSKNLRARDFEHWAKLADQVLQDPVYQDRIDWEFAENVLNGNNAKLTTNDHSLLSSDESSSSVSRLLEISKRFSWDNEDKAGWSKVNFELLGTSKGGRLPRIQGNHGENNTGRREDKEVKKVKCGEGVLGEKRRERRERRERVRLKKEEEKLGVNKHRGWCRLEDGGGGGDGGRVERSHGFDKDEAVEVYSPFPGREAFLNKVLNNPRRKRFL